MNTRMKTLAAALVTATAIAAPALSAPPSPTPLAGPWYSAKELSALKAYADMTFSEKQAYLAGARSSRTKAVPLAGPSYTPAERARLVAYSNASPDEKRAILAGATTATPGWFDRHDAAIIGAVTLALILLTSGVLAHVARRSRALRHTGDGTDSNRAITESEVRHAETA